MRRFKIHLGPWPSDEVAVSDGGRMETSPKTGQTGSGQPYSKFNHEPVAQAATGLAQAASQAPTRLVKSDHSPNNQHRKQSPYSELTGSSWPGHIN